MELSYAQKQTVEHLDEGINQLVRLSMNCNTIKGRKYYENWLKYVVNTRSNITSEPINNLIAKAIINGGLVKRTVYNNKTDEWDTEYLPTDKHINKIYNIILKKRINIFERVRMASAYKNGICIFSYFILKANSSTRKTVKNILIILTTRTT